MLRHTCLGEESAETLVRICGLALFGQVSIGLDRMTRQYGEIDGLEAVCRLYLDTVLEAV